VPKHFAALLLVFNAELCPESLHVNFTTQNGFGIRGKPLLFSPGEVLAENYYTFWTDFFVAGCQTVNIINKFFLLDVTCSGGEG